MSNPGTPVLIVIGGLPGTGKTTISRELSRRLGAAYVRIDAIEQGLRLAGHAAGVLGYVIANAIAAENLKIGRIVVADCVNPVLASREGWRKTASSHAARLIEIEIICSDVGEHRRRLENRSADISGLTLPRWQDVLDRTYEPWDGKHVVLDSATLPVNQSVDRIEALFRDKE